MTRCLVDSDTASAHPNVAVATGGEARGLASIDHRPVAGPPAIEVVGDVEGDRSRETVCQMGRAEPATAGERSNAWR